jgi:hypothetical protein
VKQQVCKASNKWPVIRLAASFALAGLLCGAATSKAGFVSVAPGQSSLLAGSAYQPPAGDVVAQQSMPFAAHYQPDGTFVDFSGVATGQFDDQVLRDPKTGELTFVYEIELNNEGYTSASQGSELTLNGYGPYQTNVAGQLQFEPTAPVQRSANGSSLSFYANSPGLGGPPELAVKTNSTRFDANGTLTYSLADLFQVNGPHGQELGPVWGTVTFKSAFRPIGPAATGGTAVAVPLPPAFYTGLGIMMACGVITLGRRFMSGSHSLSRSTRRGNVK